MIRNNQSLIRQTYDNLQKTHAGKEVAPSYLRMEVEVSNGVNKYKFEHRSIGGESSTEKKLDRNDKFYAHSMLLGFIDKTNPNTSATTDLSESECSIKTFADADHAGLEAIYNGFISLKTGSKVNFESLSALNFKYAPETQSGTGVVPQFNLMDASYAGVEDIVLHGTKSHELTLEIPAGNALLTAEQAGKVKLVFIMVGFIVKNGAAGLGA